MAFDWKQDERARKVILTLADANLNVNETARRLFMHRNSVEYHIEKVKRNTGLDPTKFHDLCKLLGFGLED